jgi:sialidase-1
MRAHMQNRRARAVSDDGGRTWSEPELCEDLPDSTCQGSILKLVRGSGSGKVILSNLNQTIDDYGAVNHCLERRNLSISVSDDQGATFPRKYSVNPGPSGYSDLAQMPDGRVVCVFENGDEVYRERLSLVRFALPQQC